MDITLFSKPDTHPYGMLSSYDKAYQKETVLAMMLSKCIKAGGFVAVKTKYAHPTMVIDGLLGEAEGDKYKLTVKAIGLGCCIRFMAKWQNRRQRWKNGSRIVWSRLL